MHSLNIPLIDSDIKREFPHVEMHSVRTNFSKSIKIMTVTHRLHINYEDKDFLFKKVVTSYLGKVQLMIQDVMDSLHIEAFFNFCIGCHYYMQHAYPYQKQF